MTDFIKIDGKNLNLTWDDINKMINESYKNDTEIDSLQELKCIKCKKTFYNKNYQGKYPLCETHLKKKIN
tara:strand:+ start:12022 stop:12231 length:210 start_codon:yes stop_codon:yes gene_type:complete